ncbi:MAG: dolichol-phosphate mannosyltransferase, partial [Angustibacter sp.]
RADLVLGSRWIPGGTVINWPLYRKLISRGGTTYARLLLGVPIRDITGGFRVFRASRLASLDLSSVESQGYCSQIDLAWRALRAGHTVIEVPITFIERERGQSKMSGAIVRESLLRVTEWGIRHRLGRR